MRWLALALVLAGGGQELPAEPQARWEPACEINVWVLPPGWPPEHGDRWCWEWWAESV